MYTFNTNFLFLHASISISLSLCLDLGLFIHLSVCLSLSLSYTSPEKLPILSEQRQQPRIHWLPHSSGEPISRAPELGMPPQPHLCSLMNNRQNGWLYCMFNPPPLLNYTLSSHEHKIALRVTTCMLYLPDTR